ncbi:MAG: hypothetical protein ACRCZF_23890, partial [Gemmataceae bacterium]
MMPWVAGILLVLSPAGGPMAKPVVSANPQSLRIGAAEQTRAEQLVRQLASDAFRDREAATRELAQMGRLALPALRTAAETSADTEVRTKAEWLLPRCIAADHQAKLATFLADTQGQYQHDLVGWNQFRTAAGDGKATRELFVEMLNHKPNSKLLAALASPEELAQLIIVRRTEIHTRMYGFGPGRERTPPTVTDIRGLILAETITTSVPDRRYNYAIYNAFQIGGPVREMATGTSEKSDAFRKLIVAWLDTRKDP